MERGREGSVRGREGWMEGRREGGRQEGEKRKGWRIRKGTRLIIAM